MKKPPKEIDGAKVLEWAWSGSIPFGTIKYKDGEMDGQTASEIYGLAICQYENSDVVYRFSCDENWETQQDGNYNSVEEAKEYLPDQYRNISANWIVFE